MEQVNGLRAKANEFAELSDWAHVAVAKNSTHTVSIGKSVMKTLELVDANKIWINVGLGVLVPMPILEAKQFFEVESKRLFDLADKLEQDFAQQYASDLAIQLCKD